MLWLLQNNYVDAMTARLAWALRLTDRQMHDFSVVPGEPLPEFPCDPDDPHFFYGSTGLVVRLGRDPQWETALFNTQEAIDQRRWHAERQQDLLNPEMQLMTLASLRKDMPKERFFVRPAIDQKAFAGHVVKDADLSGIFRTRKGLLREQPEDLLLAISPVVPEIVAEYRFVVLNHEIRLGSRYRLSGALSTAPEVPAEVISQAQALAIGWMPADFIVMDMAILPGGRARIVEFNSVHSSGLYAMNCAHFADIVEDAVHRRLSNRYASSSRRGNPA